MITLVTVVLLGFATLLVIPVTVLFVEVLAALDAVDGPNLEPLSVSSRVAVAIPAHNEGAGMLPTIRDIQSQLGTGDRLLVVADNCSDDTADVARAAGCEVLVRNDLSRIGKGYALAWAIDHLRADPPDFIIFIDADCRIQADMIPELRKACHLTGRPLQACFLMKQAGDSPIDHSLAEFAWVLKNWVRPLGLTSLNLPVQLMGTGMIFPWGVIEKASLSGGHLVEDMKLGLDLAAEGNGALFFPFVVGTSDFPHTKLGTESQRQRWVQGHLGMIGQMPKLLVRALAGRNLELFALLLDLCVPPLTLLGLMVILVLILSVLAMPFGVSAAPALVATANFMAFATAIVFAWLGYAREIMGPRQFMMLGRLFVEKVILYARMMMGRTARSWVRTDRGRSDPE